jgi:hypothetical protein
MTNSSKNPVALAGAHRVDESSALHPENQPEKYSVDPLEGQLSEFLRRVYRWGIFPYGWWIDDSGCKVIFDRKYRPICTIADDGKIVLTPSDKYICYRSRDWYYRGKNHPSNCPRTRKIILSVVQDCGLEAELRHRRRLERTGQLPRWMGAM